MIQLIHVCKIDIEKYQDAADAHIITNDVILTSNRIQHIIDRRGSDFFDEYNKYFSAIILDPDYIFKDKKNTALAAKKFNHNGCFINIVLRLSIEGENPDYKNSIITAIKENEKRFAQRLRNNTPIYKKLDNQE